MTEKTYHIDVETIGDGGRAIANAYGDLDTIAYVARKAEKALKQFGPDTSASVSIIEVRGIGEETLRTVGSATADIETIGLVLKKRIAAERKTAAGETVVPATEPSPTVDTQSTDGAHTEF